ncbi:MAG: type II toxin-antitoxin system Phd/YefM family antitoxin [Chloroflexia bacterium]
MTEVTLEEAQTHLADLIAAVRRGETVYIVGDEQDLVQLVPVSGADNYLQFGSARGLIRMAEDFDAPLEDFQEYMA